MRNALKARIKQQADFESSAVETMLNILVAADAIRTPLTASARNTTLRRDNYNVLRILRGAGAAGHPRCEIAARMLERAPDITRLIDRLEKQKLVKRAHSDENRRLSVAKISRKGLALIDRIEPDLNKVNRRREEKLSAAKWIVLTSLCKKIYAETEQEGEIKD